MIMHGNCLDKLKELDEESVDAIVTDPPYGLSFMGKKWDYDVPSIDIWKEALRVLKPGGFCLSFGGTRTYHRLVVNIEDAGFEIRDQLQWIYGSGFPKSMDISKAIDKQAGAEREVIGFNKNHRTLKETNCMVGEPHSGDGSVTTPATDAAKQWQGFGTALKPANEPIVLARKPLSEKTVAANVLKWGTGGLNIDGTRIGSPPNPRNSPKAKFNGGNFHAGQSRDQVEMNHFNPTTGRWPSNVLLDETAAEMLDAQAPKTGGGGPGARKIGRTKGNSFDVGMKKPELANQFAGPKGGASRFFYVAKASKRERNAGLEGMEKRDAPGSKRSTPAEGRTSALGAPRENFHPTVKPLKLMEYLITLVTPPGGIILDPFMGSGSTGVAAKSLGREFIGIEMNEEYVEIAKQRIAK